MTNATTRRTFAKNTACAAASALLGQSLLAEDTPPDGAKAAVPDAKPFFQTRGVIVAWSDAQTLDWPRRASQVGLTTLSVHTSVEEGQTERFRAFLRECEERHLAVEYEQHAMAELLPRSLFAQRPELFRMDEKGSRVADFNCCATSAAALDVIAENARQRALQQKPRTGRYYYWLDDGGQRCHCPSCKELGDSDQALLIENRIIKELCQLDPANTLAHLAYHHTVPAPVAVKPGPGIFLEFAPFARTWSRPLAERAAHREGIAITHGAYLDHLEANLRVFPRETAQVLEYWLDVSLFSDWKKPAVKLPWNKEVFLSDLETYARLGIRHITSFAVYVDGEYQKNHGDLSFINEYGAGLRNFRPAKPV